MRSINPDSRVYFLENRGNRTIKIGTSGDLKARTEALTRQTQQPLTLLLSIPGDRKLEATLHQAFSDSRQSGEWFHDSPRLRQFIQVLEDLDSGEVQAVAICNHTCPAHCVALP